MSAGKGDKPRSVDQEKYSNNWDKIKWSKKEKAGRHYCGVCKKWTNGSCCQKETPKKSSKFSVNVIWYDGYESSDYDGKPRKVTSIREENKLLERFDMVRMEDFDKTHPVPQQEKNRIRNEETRKTKEYKEMVSFKQGEMNGL